MAIPLIVYGIGLAISAGVSLYNSSKASKDAKNTAAKQRKNEIAAAQAIYPIQSQALDDIYVNEIFGANRQSRVMKPAIQNYAAEMSGAATAAAGMQSEGYLAAGNISNAAAQAAAGNALAAGRTAAAGVNVATEEANALQEKMYWEYVEQASPWATAGRRALDTLTERPAFEFTPDEFDFQADPSYDWRVEQGIDAIDSSGAARGRSLSGAQDKALMTYGQEMASQEYQASFDRHWNTQINEYNMASGVYNTNTNVLTGIANMGLTAAMAIGSAGQHYADVAGANTINAAAYSGNALMRTTEYAGNARMQGANALASAQIGSANALANGLLTSTGYSAGGAYSVAQLEASRLGSITDATTANILGQSNAETNYLNGMYGADSTYIESTGAADQQQAENNQNIINTTVESATEVITSD